MKYRITDGVQYVDVEREDWFHRIYRQEPPPSITIVAPMFFETTDVKVLFARTEHDHPGVTVIHTTPFVYRTPLQVAVFKTGREDLVELKDAQVWLV